MTNRADDTETGDHNTAHEAYSLTPAHPRCRETGGIAWWAGLVSGARNLPVSAADLLHDGQDIGYPLRSIQIERVLGHLHPKLLFDLIDDIDSVEAIDAELFKGALGCNGTRVELLIPSDDPDDLAIDIHAGRLPAEVAVQAAADRAKYRRAPYQCQGRRRPTRWLTGGDTARVAKRSTRSTT